MKSWAKIGIQLVLGGIVVLLAVRLFYTESSGAKDKEQRGAGRNKGVLKVTTEEVAARKVPDNLICIGTAVSRESVDIASLVTEKVINIGFQDGQFVQRGDLLVELDNAQEKVAVELADLAIAEHMREKERLEWLLKEDAIAQKDLDDRETRLKMALAEKAKAEADLADRVIRAPFTGLLGMRLVSVGDLLTPGTRIAALDDIEYIYVDFSVPEKYSAKLSTNLHFKADNIAYSGFFTGKVRAVDPRIHSETRSVSVRGEIANLDHRLRPGMLLTVYLDMGEESMLMAPESSVLSLGEKQSVFLVSADRKSVKRQPVRTGRRSDRYVEILSGVKAGDLVVTEGVGKLADGDAVVVNGTGRAD